MKHTIKVKRINDYEFQLFLNGKFTRTVYQDEEFSSLSYYIDGIKDVILLFDKNASITTIGVN